MRNTKLSNIGSGRDLSFLDTNMYSINMFITGVKVSYKAEYHYRLRGTKNFIGNGYRLYRIALNLSDSKEKVYNTFYDRLSNSVIPTLTVKSMTKKRYSKLRNSLIKL